MAEIKPFKIAIPDAKLDRLKQKLALTDFPDELEEAGWDYGTPLADVKRLTSYWRETFDWRAAEAKLNTLPHFTTTVTVPQFEPLILHFLHQRSPSPSAIPLLFCHGWPGSFLEATKILPLLTGLAPAGRPSFHLIAPSLPNFGFSAGVSRRGFGIDQYATACHQLMLTLGYEQYACQGGDWGWSVLRSLGRQFPGHCRALHTNFPTPRAPKP